MNDDEIVGLIEKSQRRVRKAQSVEIIGGIALVFVLLGFGGEWLINGAAEGALSLSCAGGVAFWTGYRNWVWSAQQRKIERGRAAYFWRYLMKKRALGVPIGGAAELSEKIAGIYQADPKGHVFPLVQALRLFDIYQKQNLQFRAARKRLNELRALREDWLDKSEQLKNLGEVSSDASALATLDAQIEKLEIARHQAHSSCYRLEEIVDGVRRTIRARQLRDELDQLSARLPSPTEAVEPAFEAQSLEEIERQIGREIETYLQLERETEERLG